MYSMTFDLVWNEYKEWVYEEEESYLLNLVVKWCQTMPMTPSEKTLKNFLRNHQEESYEDCLGGVIKSYLEKKRKKCIVLDPHITNWKDVFGSREWKIREEELYQELLSSIIELTLYDLLEQNSFCS